MGLSCYTTIRPLSKGEFLFQCPHGLELLPCDAYCTDDSGSCYVMLDDVFRETIADDSTYHVFITKEGQGDLWVAEKTSSYFIVQGTKNLGFAWEVKAKQKGYEMERLEICDPTAIKEEAIDYEEEGFKVYTDYVEQIEVTNNIGEEK